MKVAQINRYGGSEVIEIRNIPEPSASGKVIVEVHAASVNPFDVKLRKGLYQAMIPLNLPVTLGGDFSGVVRDPGVSTLKKGDAVYGQGHILGGGTGSFAEMLAADPTRIAVKPVGIDHEGAAALPLVGVSAIQALIESMRLHDGMKVLIHGGAGGIGGIAIQIAKRLGAHVAATARGADIPHVKGLGADQVIDYEQERFEEILTGFDAVFDTVGGDTYTRSFKVLKRGGIIVSMLEKPNEELMARSGVHSVYQSTEITTARLNQLTEFVEQGVVKIFVDKIFSLEKAGEAMDFLESGRHRGKVVIKIL